ncbi:hypothetical protein LCGC14_1162720 [marine sediment metagenome]|uniref:Sialidase domain-containing protein n=1 Tax=marine sediment metagenome TaxID=412755 RepID=A0A0F9PXR4_9ZZZZ
MREIQSYPHRINNLDRIIISRNDDKWQGHPDIAYFRDNIYVIYRESDRHLTPGGTAIILVRCTLIPKDNTIIATEEIEICTSEDRLNCPRLSVIDGELWITCDKIQSGDNFIAAENIQENTKILLWRSGDGQEWTGPIETNITGIVPDRICQFGNRYLIATHTKKLPDEVSEAITKQLPEHQKSFQDLYANEQKKGHLVQNVWITKDLKEDWTRVPVADQSSFNFCEASIIKLDKMLLCFMRENSGKGLPAFMSISLNGGSAWSTPQPTRLFGCHRPVVGVLESGNLLVTYREQSSVLAPSCWARNTFAALIRKDSILSSCNKSVILPLDHDASRIKSDSGYTGWVQLPTGRIVVVNYITDEAPRPYICGYLISEDNF